MRAVANASRTGYFIQKLVPHQANKYDGLYNWSGNLHTYLPYMRLADIYLMYAEACAAVDGAAGKSTNFGKTAEDAINTLRKRAGVGPVGGGEPGDEKVLFVRNIFPIPRNLWMKFVVNVLSSCL